MTTYEKNLKTLARFYPEMNQLIAEAQQKEKSELIVTEDTADNGDVILKVQKEENTLYLNGKRDTQEAAQMWVTTIGSLESNAPVLVMGTGNLFYIKFLAEQTENRITIFVYEPCLQIFLKFLEQADLEKWMEKHLMVFWVGGLKDMDEKHMKNLLGSMLAYEMLGYSRYLILPNYDVLFPEEAVAFAKICRDIAVGEIIGFNSRKLFSGVMAKNLLSNARYLCDGYKTTQLTGVIPRDIPGIVVAAGPSLNKNIQELKKAKGKAFIIAVDTAIKPLLQAGIVPDMFAVIDPLKPLELVQMEGVRRVPLVSTLNAAPEVLDFHTGMKFFYNEGYQFAERIFLKSGQKVGDVSTGGSVATSVFSLLYKIGLDTIILVGQDLAYTDNKSHADGTFYEVMPENDTSYFQMVEGNYEEKVPTAGDLKQFLDWYNMYIEGCMEHRKNFRVINATEGGAKIKNTEVMTLREAIARECDRKVDIGECLSKLSPMLTKEKRQEAVDYLKGISKDFHQLLLEATRIEKLYRKLDVLCSRKKIDTKEYLNLLKRLEKQIKEIEKTSVYQMVAITMDQAKAILRNEQFLSEGSLQAEGKEIARKGMLYMQNVEEMAKLFEKVAEDTFQDLI